MYCGGELRVSHEGRCDVLASEDLISMYVGGELSCV